VSDTGAPRTHPQATTALVISIVGIFVLGLVLGALAVYMGVRARGDIEYSQGQLTGTGRATAAVIIGILEILAWVIGAVIVIAAVR
jgi:hypothetical protein